MNLHHYRYEQHILPIKLRALQINYTNELQLIMIEFLNLKTSYKYNYTLLNKLMELCTVLLSVNVKFKVTYRIRFILLMQRKYT